MKGRPTLQQYRYAVALADEANFGRAATACDVSQPALSAQIRQLEKSLGVVLFERSTRRVVVTSHGADLIARARRVLESADELELAAKDARDPFSGSMRIGVIPTVAPYVLPRALHGIRAAYPNLKPYLREDQTDRLIDLLLAGRLDVLLLAIPLRRPGIEELPLFEDPFLLAVPRGHRLAKRKAVKELDLERERLVLLEEGHCLREQALQVCGLARAGDAEVQATSLGTVVQMVGSGIGLTLLPATAADVEVDDGDPIVLRPFTSPAPTRTIGLAWRKGSALGAAYRELGSWFTQLAAPDAPRQVRSVPPVRATSPSVRSQDVI